MKKTFFFLLTLMLCVGMLAGCSQNGENKSDKITVYSFCGENEQFAVTNGVIVISADEEIFYGGDLKVTDDEYFSDVTSYSVKFYTMTNGKTRTIMHNSVRSGQRRFPHKHQTTPVCVRAIQYSCRLHQSDLVVWIP